MKKLNQILIGVLAVSILAGCAGGSQTASSTEQDDLYFSANDRAVSKPAPQSDRANDQYALNRTESPVQQQSYNSTQLGGQGVNTQSRGAADNVLSGNVDQQEEGYYSDELSAMSDGRGNTYIFNNTNPGFNAGFGMAMMPVNRWGMNPYWGYDPFMMGMMWDPYFGYYDPFFMDPWMHRRMMRRGGFGVSVGFGYGYGMMWDPYFGYYDPFWGPRWGGYGMGYNRGFNHGYYTGFHHGVAYAGGSMYDNSFQNNRRYISGTRPSRSVASTRSSGRSSREVNSSRNTLSRNVEGVRYASNSGRSSTTANNQRSTQRYTPSSRQQMASAAATRTSSRSSATVANNRSSSYSTARTQNFSGNRYNTSSRGYENASRSRSTFGNSTTPSRNSYSTPSRSRTNYGSSNNSRSNSSWGSTPSRSRSNSSYGSSPSRSSGSSYGGSRSSGGSSRSSGGVSSGSSRSSSGGGTSRSSGGSSRGRGGL